MHEVLSWKVEITTLGNLMGIFLQETRVVCLVTLYFDESHLFEASKIVRHSIPMQ